ASRNQSLEKLDRQQDRERKPVVFKDAEIKEMERENTITALHFSGWRIYGLGGAAELLGLKPTTLAARIRKMGIKKPDKK
ncbi:MAG: hypothetical protein K8S18_00440, partial [Desulfobacula sp.]|nr:hypothetical protein [Desulfobacula sp.]